MHCVAACPRSVRASLFWCDRVPRQRKPTSPRHGSFGLGRQPPPSLSRGAARGGVFWPPTAARGLVCGDHVVRPPRPPGGQGRGGRWLSHRAVLSVSLSASSRRWPGRSLLAESGCISGRMPRSGSVPLGLASGQKQRHGINAGPRKRPPEGRWEGSWDLGQPCTPVPGPGHRPPSEVQSSLSRRGSRWAGPVLRD